jgi:hypothetical protein
LLDVVVVVVVVVLVLLVRVNVEFFLATPVPSFRKKTG